MEYRRIGRSDLVVSAVGLGAWQWGSRAYWGFGGSYGMQDLVAIRDAALGSGINLFDTAELYGRGESERIIGEIVPKGEEVVIATKYWPFKLSSDSVFRSVDKSLRRLKVREIDLYQIHWPNPTNSLSRLMRNMERLIKLGKIRYIGLSNFGVKGMERANEALSFSDIASNQVSYSLLDRRVEANGVMDYCRKNRISVLAWSPLGQGLLTGRFRPGVRVRGMRRLRPAFSDGNRRRIEPLLKELEGIGIALSKTPSQVALNWLLRDETVVAIPGASNPGQVLMNSGSVGWRLGVDDLARLDAVCRACSR